MYKLVHLITYNIIVSMTKTINTKSPIGWFPLSSRGNVRPRECVQRLCRSALRWPEGGEAHEVPPVPQHERPARVSLARLAAPSPVTLYIKLFNTA